MLDQPTKKGRRFVDKLVGVRLLNGTEVQLLAQENKMTYITIEERWATKEAQSDLLLSMIQHRFGAIPDDITQRLLAAHSPQLKTWALNLVDAASLDDIFRD